MIRLFQLAMGTFSNDLRGQLTRIADLTPATTASLDAAGLLPPRPRSAAEWPADAAVFHTWNADLVSAT